MYREEPPQSLCDLCALCVSVVSLTRTTLLRRAENFAQKKEAARAMKPRAA